PVETAAPDEFFFEVGLAIFCRALSEKDRDWAELIAYKLNPKKGYLLKRMISEAFVEERTEDPKKLQDAILARFVSLVRRGETDQGYWGTVHGEEETQVLNEEAA
ncbi:MAG: hypothetical protein Q7S00_01055, partial [bacterium]|nr:hypothetical protein [bacterium]